jgi:hypothetical protein
MSVEQPTVEEIEALIRRDLPEASVLIDLNSGPEGGHQCSVTTRIVDGLWLTFTGIGKDPAAALGVAYSSAIEELGRASLR